MFKSLQSRLLLSYLLLIAVVLILVGLLALLLLRSYQQELAFERLTERAALATRLASEILRRGGTEAQIVERLPQPINAGGGQPISLYLLDAAGNVVAGSDDRLLGQRFEHLALQPTPPAVRALRGERLLGTGERLLYVAQLFNAAGRAVPRDATHVLVLTQPFRPGRPALGQLLPRLVWPGIIALALALMLAALIAYSIARPMDRMARAAEEIAAGNYQQLDIRAPREVARLATSLNKMARQIEATLQSQQDLVANVSHELKTPLTSIQGFSQALLDGTAADEAARERAAAIIHEEAGRMRRLVKDLLDLARLEAGQIALAREPIDVEALVGDVQARFSPRLAQGRVALDVQVASALPVLMGDADRLGQVLDNLVDNALKHAGGLNGEGRVVLSVQEIVSEAASRPRCVRFSVTDNGPGIPPEDLARVFERFYQVDKSRVRKGDPAPRTKSGAGLGLAIAREIVQAHDGRIWAESVQGLGTRFSLDLPARPKT